VLVSLMAYFEFGPALLFEKDMLPFLFNKLVIPVGLIVPLGAIFLAFLISYGLLELIGVLFQPEHEVLAHPRLKLAMLEGLEANQRALRLLVNIRLNLKEGLLMAMSILPSIMSVGLIGLLLAKYTPLFDWMGYLFYPFTALAQLPDALLVAKASATGLAFWRGD
jgi:nucleoside recognition membrane protein YjiH